MIWARGLYEKGLTLTGWGAGRRPLRHVLFCTGRISVVALTRCLSGIRVFPFTRGDGSVHTARSQRAPACSPAGQGQALLIQATGPYNNRGGGGLS